MSIRETDIQIGFKIDIKALDRLEKRMSSLDKKLSKSGFDELEKDAKRSDSTIKKVDSSLSKIGTTAGRMSTSIKKAFGGTAISKFKSSVSSISAPFSKIKSAASNAGTFITNKFKSLGGTFKSVGGKVDNVKSSFGKLKSAASDSGGKIKQVFATGVTGAIMKAQMALGALKNAFMITARAAKSVFTDAMNLEQTTMSIEALAGSSKKADKIMDMLRKKGQTSIYSEEEFYKAGQSMMSLVKNTDDLTTSMNVLERLSASNPAAGIEQATFSMKEFLTGDYTSIVDAFNMDRASVKKALEGTDTIEQRMKALDGLLKNMGFDDNYIKKMNTTAGAMLDNITSNIKTNFVNMGSQALEALKPALSAVQKWLDSGGFDKFGEKMKAGMEKAINFVKTGFQWIQDNNVLDKLKATWDTLAPVLKAAFDGIKSVVKTIADNLKEWVISDEFQNILGIVKDKFKDLEPTIKKVSDKLVDVFNWIDEHRDGIIALLAGVAAGLATIKAVQIGKWFISLIPIIWKFSTTLYACPLTWIVAAVIAVVAALVLLWLKWDEVTKFLSKCWDTLKTKFGQLKEYLNNKMDNIREKFVSGWQTIKDKAIAFSVQMATKVKEKVDEIKSFFSNLPSTIAGYLKKGKTALVNALKDVANAMLKKLANGVNKISGGINWVLDKVGSKIKIPEWQPAYLAKGTKNHKGGPAVVGEKGRELISTPDGAVSIAGENGAQYIPNLPKGSAVLPNKQTNKLLGTGIGHYANGVGDFFKNILDKALDVFQYATNPSGLISKVFEKVGVPTFDDSSFFMSIMKNGVIKIKDAASNFIKDKLAAFAESFGGGTFTGAGTGSIAGRGFGGLILTSPFGWRRDPFTGKSKFHSGIDLAGPMGTPIYARQGGTVVTAGWNGGYGNLVEIMGNNRLLYRYGHNSALRVRRGQKVNAGQLISLMGSTGRSTGSHLHFEVRRNGVAINPVPYYGKGGIFDKPSMGILGDKGKEMALPLIGKNMLPFAAAVATNISKMATGYGQEPLYNSGSTGAIVQTSSGTQNNQITIQINGAENPTTTANSVIDALESYFGRFNRRNPRVREV